MEAGPFGKSDGDQWDAEVPAGQHITEIRIWAGATVDALAFFAKDAHGASYQIGNKKGGGGGDEHLFGLADDEYLTGVSGRAGGGSGVTQLVFITNKRTSPQYGTSGSGTDFHADLGPEEVFKVWGTMGSAFLGAYVINSIVIRSRSH